MARHLQGARSVALGLCSTLLATTAFAAAASAAPAAKRIHLDHLRGRAGRAVTAQHVSPRIAASPGAEKVAATSRDRVASSDPRTGAPTASPGGILRSAAGSTDLEAHAASADTSAATAARCTADQLSLSILTDRTVVHAAYPGATSLTVQRKFDGGTWRTVRSAGAASVVVNDTTINGRTWYTYRLIAKVGTTVKLDCSMVDLYGTWTGDGFGTPDAVVAGTTGLFQQDQWTAGDRVAPLSWVSPAYSTDGRLIAATKVIDPATGRAVLEVRRAVNAALVFTVDLGSAEFPSDPAFSPDGQTLAYTRYDAATGDAKSLGFVDVFGSHTKRALNTAAPVGEPSWRPDGASLVVTDFRDGGGLAIVSSTGTTVTPLAGTTGGFTPEVGPDGSIWFANADDLSSSLEKKSTSGTVTQVRTSDTDFFISPRLTPNGALYVEQDTPDPVDPNAYTMTVYQVDPTNVYDVPTAIGVERGATGANGWDLRQPQSKGTSDFVGDAHHDIVARDTAGTLWAYRSELGNSFVGRAKLGSGWGGFTAIVAAGDLNSDDQADLVARDTAGALWLYRSKPMGGFYPRTRIGTGWAGFYLVATGDFNGDDKADLIARDGKGTLWLYPGTGRGTLAPRVQIGVGWTGMKQILGSGDVDYDGKADLLARDATGRTYLYPGTGKGGFLGRRDLGNGLTEYNAIVVTEVTYGYANAWARTQSGELYRWAITADGVLTGPLERNGTGWSPYLLTS